MRALGRDGIGVTVAQVVPPVTNRNIPIVAEYMAAFEKFTGKKEFGATSLEAYIAAKITAEGIRRAGGARATRETLITALEGSDFLSEWDRETTNAILWTDDYSNLFEVAF